MEMLGICMQNADAAYVVDVLVLFVQMMLPYRSSPGGGLVPGGSTSGFLPPTCSALLVVRPRTRRFGLRVRFRGDLIGGATKHGRESAD